MMEANKDKKWVAIYGNAMSITENRPATYSKNITLRYTIFCPFFGEKIRLTFDNYCGNDDIRIRRASILYKGNFTELSFGGKEAVEIAKGSAVESDPCNIDIKATDTFEVSFYLEDYTSMRSGVTVMGPLSKGMYAIGDMTRVENIPIEVSQKTNVFFFLSDISVYTHATNHAIVCYGDSITAQDWPDYLMQKLLSMKVNNVSVVRKATSGSRILREYSCITYESYGLKAKNRFPHELPVDGADTIIIQQGINDIIHPVGEDINIFRPMSDLPSTEELIDGLKYYIEEAAKLGLKTYVGTLLPIKGWRTYADFREVMKNEYNDWIRANTECIDFDEALRDESDLAMFRPEYDSQDHLHPSKEGYAQMAQAAYDAIRWF